METIATIQVFRDEGMAEAESGSPESIGRHRIDTCIVAVIKSSALQS